MHQPTTHPRRHTPLLTAVLATALVAAATLAFAQAGTGAEEADASVDRPSRSFVWFRGPAMMPSGHARMGGAVGPVMPFRGATPQAGAHRLGRGASSDQGALFARWLEHTPDAGPIVPGLVGRVPDSTEVRLHLYDGDPANTGALIATLTYVAGSDDLTAFQADVREAAAGATHVVIDVLGRTVALPEAQSDGDATD